MRLLVSIVSLLLYATCIQSQSLNEDNIIRIAHLQISAFDNAIEQNKLKAEFYCRKADSMGVDLVLFPEMYSIGCSGFNKEIPGEKEAWLSQAITQDNEFIKHFIKLSKELGVAIAITFLEKENQEYYNTVLVVDRYGKTCLKHRKVHLYEPLANEAACKSGNDFYVCELNTEHGSFQLGAMICADYYFPESARILMLKGAEIVIVPNAAPITNETLVMLKSRSMENAIGIALTNYPKQKICDFCCTGLSTAFNPWYKNTEYNIFLADESEGIFISEFNLNKIRDYRKKTYFGNSFRHPAIYKSLLDTTVNEPFKGRKTGLGMDFHEKRKN